MPWQGCRCRFRSNSCSRVGDAPTLSTVTAFPDMSFFKRKDKSAIPPPPPEPSLGQQRAQLFGGSTASNALHDDPYANRRAPSIAPSYASQDPYATRSNGQSSSSSGAGRSVETDPARAALFAGYNPDAIPREVGRRQYGDREGGEYGGEQAQENEDEDVEAIKRDIRGVKQESLGSTRSVQREEKGGRWE